MCWLSDDSKSSSMRWWLTDSYNSPGTGDMFTYTHIHTHSRAQGTLSWLAVVMCVCVCVCVCVGREGGREGGIFRWMASWRECDSRVPIWIHLSHWRFGTYLHTHTYALTYMHWRYTMPAPKLWARAEGVRRGVRVLCWWTSVQPSLNRSLCLELIWSTEISQASWYKNTRYLVMWLFRSDIEPSLQKQQIWSLPLMFQWLLPSAIGDGCVFPRVAVSVSL